MRLRGITLTLTGTEGSTPPLPFIEVEDGEAEALLKSFPEGSIIVVSDEDGAEPAEPVEPAPVAPAEPPVAQVPSDSENSPSEDDAGDTNTFAEILDAVELLDADDFVKTGDRKGKPKVDAVAAILERDVTAEEIDSALASSDT